MDTLVDFEEIPAIDPEHMQLGEHFKSIREKNVPVLIALSHSRT